METLRGGPRQHTKSKCHYAKIAKSAENAKKTSTTILFSAISALFAFSAYGLRISSCPSPERCPECGEPSPPALSLSKGRGSRKARHPAMLNRGVSEESRRSLARPFGRAGVSD